MRGWVTHRRVRRPHADVDDVINNVISGITGVFSQTVTACALNEYGRGLHSKWTNKGKFLQQSIEYYRTVIEQLKQRGCDAVILGCTEIPLIIDESNSSLPILDSTRLLARAALRSAVV